MSTAVATIEEHKAQTVFKTAQPTRHVDALKPHPDNPREEIDREDPKIVEMSRSIEQHGVIEPLVITPDGLLIAGHRRRVAARVAAERSKRPELLYVPVTIRDIKPGDALELMLQENMQRESLSPLEEARAMYAIMKRGGLILSDLARAIAVPIHACNDRLAILKCEPEVQALFAQNELPLSSAIWLAQCDLREQQINYAGMLARRQMTLAQLKEAMREASYKERKKKAAEPRQSGKRTADDYRKPQKPHVPEQHQRPITRAEAEAALNKIPSKRITMHLLRNVLDTVCCSCGMQSQEKVCVGCPLPRLVLGIVGRAQL